jgi:hypothetical protein
VVRKNKRGGAQRKRSVRQMCLMHGPIP